MTDSEVGNSHPQGENGPLITDGQRFNPMVMPREGRLRHCENGDTTIEMNTKSIVVTLTQTLDMEKFFQELEQLATADQRHCAHRALDQLCKSDMLMLHGSQRVREVIALLREYLS